MSALGVSHSLRGGGRAGKGGPGRARLAADPAPGGPALDITAIFRQHYPELVRLAVMLVGDRPTAEDVVQDVFATLHARRDRPGPRGDPLAYVRACVLNGCRSALRRRTGLSRIGGSAAPVPDLSHESAEHEAIQAEGRRQVLAALAAATNRVELSLQFRRCRSGRGLELIALRRERGHLSFERLVLFSGRLALEPTSFGFGPNRRVFALETRDLLLQRGDENV